MFFAPREAAGIYMKIQSISLAQFGLVKTLAQGFAISCLAMSLYIFFQGMVRGRMIWLAIVFSIVSNVIANFPLAIARYYLAALFLILLLTAFKDAFSKFRRLVYVAVPALLYLVFPTLGKFNRHTTLEFKVSDISFSEYLTHADLDGFQSVMNVVLLVQEQGFSLGSRMLSWVFFFVPRSMWSGKQNPTGSDAAQNAGYFFHNISMPLPGELYADGGVPLVFIGMLLIGWLARRLDFFVVYPNQRTYLISIIGVIFAAFSPILFRGSLLAIIAAFISACFLVYLALGIEKIFRSAAQNFN